MMHLEIVYMWEEEEEVQGKVRGAHLPQVWRAVSCSLFDYTSPSYKDPFSKPLNRTEPSFTALQVRERGVSTNQPLLSTHVKNKIEVKIYLHISMNQIGILIIKTSCCGQKVAKHDSFTTGGCL